MKLKKLLKSIKQSDAQIAITDNTGDLFSGELDKLPYWFVRTHGESKVYDVNAYQSKINIYLDDGIARYEGDE